MVANENIIAVTQSEAGNDNNKKKIEKDGKTIAINK